MPLTTEQATARDGYLLALADLIDAAAQEVGQQVYKATQPTDSLGETWDRTVAARVRLRCALLPPEPIPGQVTVDEALAEDARQEPLADGRKAERCACRVALLGYPTPDGEFSTCEVGGLLHTWTECRPLDPADHTTRVVADPTLGGVLGPFPTMPRPDAPTPLQPRPDAGL